MIEAVGDRGQASADGGAAPPAAADAAGQFFAGPRTSLCRIDWQARSVQLSPGAGVPFRAAARRILELYGAASEGEAPAVPKALAELVRRLDGGDDDIEVEFGVAAAGMAGGRFRLVGRVVARHADGLPRRMAGALQWLGERRRARPGARGRGEGLGDAAPSPGEVERLRRLLARDVHDELGPTLAAARLRVEQLVRAVPSGADVDGALAQVQALLEHAAAQTRAWLAGPTTAAAPAAPGAPRGEDGVVAVLEGVLERFSRWFGIDAALAVRGELASWPAEAVTVLRRVVQEALTNVARHAGTRRVRVSVAGDRSGLQLAVEDDGVGFDPALPAPAARTGLSGMRARVGELGGRLTVDSTPGAGTRLCVWLPVAAR